MSAPIILHLCADIGSDSQPWRSAGYDVRCIGKDIGVENYHPPENVYGVIANPVCTEFSVATGFHKTGNHDAGMFLVNECLRIIRECSPQFWVIENPATGRLKDFIGPPVMTYEPWMFGSPWTKKTALWGKFHAPERHYNDWESVPKNPYLYIRPGRPKPSLAFLHKSAKQYIREFDCFEVADDMSFRSLCSQGFAQAFYEANKGETMYTDPDFKPEKPAVQHYLHHYTFEELAATTDPIIDWSGIMWAGPNRRGINAPNPVDLWKAWQKDVQKAAGHSGVLTPHVMTYFQATKGLSRPPKKGEITIESEPFKFTWSFSQLSQFESCPFQWAEERYYLNIPRQDTDATRWGTTVHTAFEDYVNSLGQKCAPVENFMGGLKYAQALVAAQQKGATVLTEFKMALDRQLKPVAFEDGWARGIADIVIIKDKIARIWDWKTGKEKDDQTQLLIFCAFLAQHFPHLEEFQAEFVWLKTDKKIGMPRAIARRELLPVWKNILGRVKRMEDAIASETFEKRVNGLCKAWCSATNCNYCGKGYGR